MIGFDEGDASGALDGLTSQMLRLNVVTDQFGKTLSRSLASGIAQGKGFEDILRNIGTRMIDIALRAAFKPLENGISSALSGLFRGVGGVFSGGGSSGGSPFDLGGATGFASGGVINAPHYFPLGRGAGLAGERGAEAILPLARGPDGRLGVAAGGKSTPVNINMVISTPDAESFRRSEAQIGAALARAVARGQRNL